MKTFAADVGTRPVMITSLEVSPEVATLSANPRSSVTWQSPPRLRLWRTAT